MGTTRVFRLEREQDITGVSGTGHVADGVEFANGKCVVSWNGPYNTVTVYDSIYMVEAIHTHGGATKIVFEGER